MTTRGPSDSVWKITGDRPGPTVAIFGGVHGDERAGVQAVERLTSSLRITAGTVYLVLANPAAIAAGVRMVDGANLNRRFLTENDGTGPVDERARELTALLDRCDACLDLHEHKDDSTGSFIACEPPSFEVARSLGAPIITYDWLEAEPGATDSYMYERGKIGICFEAGSNARATENVDLHLETVRRFLAACGLTGDAPPPEPAAPPRFVRILRAIHKRTADFRLTKDFRSFEALPDGEVFAVDGGREYRAGQGELIIFPRPQNAIGTEACIIGEASDEYTA